MPNQNNSLYYFEQKKRADLAAVLLSQAVQDVAALPRNPESIIRWEFSVEKIKVVLAQLEEGLNAERAHRAAVVEEEFNSKTLFSAGDVCRMVLANHGGAR